MADIRNKFKTLTEFILKKGGAPILNNLPNDPGYSKGMKNLFEDYLNFTGDHEFGEGLNLSSKKSIRGGQAMMKIANKPPTIRGGQRAGNTSTISNQQNPRIGGEPQ